MIGSNLLNKLGKNNKKFNYNKPIKLDFEEEENV